MKVRARANMLTDEEAEQIGASKIIRPKFSQTVGQSYTVLGLCALSLSEIYGRTVLYRIIDDDGRCILSPAQLFDITDGRPSAHWCARFASGDFFLCPEPFYERYFFDDLSEAVPSVVARFAQIRQLLEAEHDE